MEANPQCFFILDVRQEEDKWIDKINPNKRGLDGLSNSAYFFDDIKHCWLTREQKSSMRDYFRSGLSNP